MNKLLISALACAVLTVAQAKKPNIIFILSDDQGWTDVETPSDPDIPEASSDYLETPNLTRLAQSGMRFSEAYSPAPICTPTRRSVQCGMTPARQRGTEFRATFDWTGQPTIPRILKAIDPSYRCAHFGKWGEYMGASPTDAGYDASDGMTGNIDGLMLRGKDTYRDHPVGKNGDPKKIFSVTRSANDFMEEQVAEGNPFYLQVSHYAVHVTPEMFGTTLEHFKSKGTPERRYSPGFAAMLADMDTGIGQILDKVNELGIADNTYIIFSSDNGGTNYPGQGERIDRNAPLSMYKQWLYEGGVKVPFIVAGPGIPEGSVSKVPVILYDLLPTFAALAGDGAAVPPTVDGGDISPLFQDGSGEVERPFDGLVFHRPRKSTPPLSYSALRRGDYKLVVDWTDEKLSLYNIAADPGEKSDLAQQNGQKRRVHDMYSDLCDYLFAVNAEDLHDTNRFLLPIVPEIPVVTEGEPVVWPAYYSGWTEPEGDEFSFKGVPLLPPWADKPSRLEVDFFPRNNFVIRVYNHSLNKSISEIVLSSSEPAFKRVMDGYFLRTSDEAKDPEKPKSEVVLTFTPALGPGQSDAAKQMGSAPNLRTDRIPDLRARIVFNDGSEISGTLVQEPDKGEDGDPELYAFNFTDK